MLFRSLAHVEQTEDLCGVSGTRSRMNDDGFSALVPIPNGRGRHRAAPFGLGPWDGARVASTAEPCPPPRSSASYQVTITSGIAPKEEGGTTSQDSAGCSIRVAMQLEIPPVWANSRSDRGCGVSARNRQGNRTMLCMEWPLRRGIRTR